MKRENLGSRYLSQELFLSGAETQSIMGEMPKCPAKLELIPWHVASIVREETQVLEVGPGAWGGSFGILLHPAP